MPLTEAPPFGTLLKQLRKRVGMTQSDLAAAVNYSGALISSLEKGKGQPNLEAVITRFIQALGLQDDPVTAAHLIERAAEARGERPPASVTFQHATRLVIQEELDEQPGALPSQPTELIGRSEEVNQLCNRLLGHSGRLLTLVGPPGIGKTRLAQAVATHLKHSYPDGAVFVPLAEIYDLVLMASTIFAAVGGRVASPKPAQAQLIEHLRHKTMLLVLDNCEQIRDAASLVSELLSACTKLVVLATSRERLHLRAEQRYRVPPLELASAVELFSRRAAAVDADFALTALNRPTVEAICQRLDRLPLAIELCAAQIDLLSLTQLLAHLHTHRLDLLEDGAQDLPLRQRTLRHAIQSSYTLLSEEERALFRSLGVFSGGFALPELEELSLTSWEGGPHGQSQDSLALLATLHALIGKSLVRAETLPSGEQRFLLLETIREFAVEQLRSQGEEAHLRARHFATYLQLFRNADSHLRGLEAAAWFERLKPDRDNLRAALQWAVDEARYEDAAWLILAVGWFWSLCGHGAEEARWLTQLLPHRQVFATDLRQMILLAFYRAAFPLQEFQLFDRHVDEIMQLVEGCSQPLLQAGAWYFIGTFAADVSQAATAYARSIACARAASEAPEPGPAFGAFNDREFVLASGLQTYASVLIDQGEIAQAAPMTAESLMLYQRRGDKYGIGDCLANLGRVALLRGDLARAKSLFEEVVTTATSIRYQTMQCTWQPLLGLVTLYGGDPAEARRLLNESLLLCLEMKDQHLLARHCTYLAEVALWEGEFDQTEQWLVQSLMYHADPRSNTRHEVERLFVAARLAMAQEEYERAATIFGLAQQMRSHTRYDLVEPVRAPVEAALATVREMLGIEVFAEAFATGQKLSLDEAFTTLLAPAQITSIVNLPTLR